MSCPRERQKHRREGGSNSVVESQPSKLLVAGSIPVSRSILRSTPEQFASSDGWQAIPGAKGKKPKACADLSAVA